MISPQVKKTGNPQNYKIVKCKYFEIGNMLIYIDGTCRYGSLCTFAHGDSEIRSKADNMLMSTQYERQLYPYDQGIIQNPNNPYIMYDQTMMMAMQYMSMMGYQQGNPDQFNQVNFNKNDSNRGNTN